MKIKLALIFLLTLAARIQAQGIESPSITSFKPDTSLPKVNVPEFVITGKAQIELPRADKPSVEIDSSYFQGKQIQSIGVDIPVSRSISDQQRNSENESPSLFARASIGHYTTTHYLLSGSGGVDGYLINGSLSGDYSSGFIANTMQRDISIQGGAVKSFGFEGPVTASNSLELNYSRSSYFLYGGWPTDLGRIVKNFSADILSDINLGEFPLTARLSYHRFSFEDGVESTIEDLESSASLNLATHFSLPSGDIGVGSSLQFGNHTIGLSPIPIILNPYGLLSLDRSNYMITAGVKYANSLQNLSYSVALNYFQYKDDLSDGIGKLYPDFGATYRLNEIVSVFAGFKGSVTQESISSVLSTDRFADRGFPLVNIQNYADFTVGGNIALSGEVRITPQFNIQGSKYYPVFVTPLLTIQEAAAGSADNSFFYAKKATIFSGSLAAEYRRDQLSASATIQFQSGTADSLSSIPNLPPFDFSLGASYHLSPQFVARGSFMFLSSRYSDLALVNKLGDAGLLNFRLSYGTKIATLPFEFFLEGSNLLNQKYFIWQGYQEFPLTLSIGLSSRIL